MVAWQPWGSCLATGEWGFPLCSLNGIPPRRFRPCRLCHVTMLLRCKRTAVSSLVGWGESPALVFTTDIAAATPYPTVCTIGRDVRTSVMCISALRGRPRMRFCASEPRRRGGHGDVVFTGDVAVWEGGKCILYYVISLTPPRARRPPARCTLRAWKRGRCCQAAGVWSGCSVAKQRGSGDSVLVL